MTITEGYSIVGEVPPAVKHATQSNSNSAFSGENPTIMDSLAARPGESLRNKIGVTTQGERSQWSKGYDFPSFFRPRYVQRNGVPLHAEKIGSTEQDFRYIAPIDLSCPDDLITNNLILRFS